MIARLSSNSNILTFNKEAQLSINYSDLRVAYELQASCIGVHRESTRLHACTRIKVWKLPFVQFVDGAAKWRKNIGTLVGFEF